MTEIVQISSGRGPVECSWVVAKTAEIFQNEAAQFDTQVQLLETVPDQMKGTFKSIQFKVWGSGAIRFLELWVGIIQWTGQSPFRPHHKRKNWFIQVERYSEGFKKEDNNLFKVETMRAQGPGGQHVNKTSSAVRITHIESGLTAKAQDGRSQNQNRKLAKTRLLEKLDRRQDGVLSQMKKTKWQKHNDLQRGNPNQIFSGLGFKRVR